MAKMDKATLKVTEAMEKGQFNTALDEIRNFAWRDLCDNYIEAAKHRLYNSGIYGEEKRKAAQYALYTALYRFLRLFAPVAPHITEEIYQTMFAEDMGYRSIHVTPWPDVGADYDQEALEKGDLLVAVISEIRREKSRKRMPLNAPIKELTVHAANRADAVTLSEASEHITGTCKIERITITSNEGEGVEVQGFKGVKFEGVC